MNSKSLVLVQIFTQWSDDDDDDDKKGRGSIKLRHHVLYIKIRWHKTVVFCCYRTPFSSVKLRSEIKRRCLWKILSFIS